MPHGGWRGGHLAGNVSSHGKRFCVQFRSKEYPKSKSFDTRAKAEAWRKRKSNKKGLTRNRVRTCPTHVGVMEMCTSSGAVIRFDAQDYSLVKPHSWYIDSNQYARAGVNGREVRMASLIKPAPRGLVIDHVNRLKHDNVRSNLRHVTQTVNTRNCNARSDNTSGYHGVHERHKFCFTHYDRESNKRKIVTRGCTGAADHVAMREKVVTLRDRLQVTLKNGSVPKITHQAAWCVAISCNSADGGRKTFPFSPADASERQTALQRAVAERDRLQAQTRSTNGK